MAREKKASERKTGVAAWNESMGTGSRANRQGKSRRNRAEADRKRRSFLLVALLVLCVASIVCAWPIKKQITRGLWLKEGTSYSITATQEDGSTPTSDQMSQAVGEIQSRLAASGISEYAVSQEGDSTIVITLSNLIDGEDVARVVGGAGNLEFVRVDEVGDADALVKINAGTKNVPMDKGTYASFMDGSSVTEASVEDSGTGTYVVRIVFDDEGSTTFADVTRELAEDSGAIAIVVDGSVVTAPTVSQEIDGGEVYISGDFSSEEADALKAVLDGNPLPLDLTYAGSRDAGPLLGKAGLWGLVGVAVAAFAGVSVVAFRKFGKLSVLVVGAMVVFACLMLGCMALASRLGMFVLTISGVGGGACAAVATLSCAWLVAARFRDKVRDGKTIRGAATSAPAEGLSPVAYPCAGAAVLAMVLVFVPMPALRDFGLTLVFGIVCGILAIGWYEITHLRLLAAGAIQKDPAAWGVAPSALGNEPASNQNEDQ